MAMEEKVRTPTSKDKDPPYKSEKFPEALSLLSKIHNGNLIEDLTNLEFKTYHIEKKKKKEGETIKEKKQKQEELKVEKPESKFLDEIGKLQESNILIKKEKLTNGEEIMSISFHSRRVHFAFNRWLAE